MNTTRKNLIPPAQLAEAGVWIARLHGPDRDRTLEAGFRRWLEADPRNRAAFELSTEVWEDAQNLRRVIPLASRTTLKPRIRFKLRLVAGSAMLVLAVVALLVYLRADRVATSTGEQRMLSLEDGTRIYLNTATRVAVRYQKTVRAVELETGEALFDVARRPNWPFIVKAGDRQVTALGTSFVVRRDAQQLSVTLVDGRVSVSGDSDPRTAPPIVLAPGQRLTMAKGRAASLDTPSLEKSIAWRRGQVVLDDTTLSNAVDEMNRYSSVKLRIEQPEAGRLIVNGLFQAGDTASFAHVLEHAYGFRVIERSGEIVLEGKPKSVSR